jgi:hypothetical protein
VQLVAVYQFAADLAFDAFISISDFSKAPVCWIAIGSVNIEGLHIINGIKKQLTLSTGVIGIYQLDKCATGGLL